MMGEAATQQQQSNGCSDFDFEIGRWRVHHRQLTKRLKGSTTWEEFEGIAVARKTLGGLGMFDEITNQRGSALIYGMTLRVFDPLTQQWSMYMATSAQRLFTVPMIGGFTNGMGRFHVFGLIEGRHIFTRFLWVDITATSYRWEQAFSADGGNTWETNWIQDYIRLSE